MEKKNREIIKSRERKLQLAAPFHRGKPMKLRLGKSGYFWGASQYPLSKRTQSLTEEELDYLRNG